MIRSLRIRIMLWFTLGMLVVLGVFATATYLHLHKELAEKSIAEEYPDHPDWNLHGNASDAEIRDIMEEIMGVTLLFSLPLLGLVVWLGYFLAGKALEPIKEINAQLGTIDSSRLDQPIRLHSADKEFCGLTEHFNQLLGRLDRSFTDIREYAAKIAHELRTPLTILRLKVEQADDRMDPDLREEFQDELRFLSRMVDQSLLIARCEQGTAEWRSEEVDCSALLEELVDDFRPMLLEEGRDFKVSISMNCVISTDRGLLKQMLVSFFANALKHGVGIVHVRLCPKDKGDHLHLVMTNAVKPLGDLGEQGLGLGLRVARAIISLQNGVRYQDHCGQRFYAMRLILPSRAI